MPLLFYFIKIPNNSVFLELVYPSCPGKEDVKLVLLLLWKTVVVQCRDGVRKTAEEYSSTFSLLQMR